MDKAFILRRGDGSKNFKLGRKGKNVKYDKLIIAYTNVIFVGADLIG